MQPSRYADREGRLAAEGREKYRGTARIALDVLYFPWDQPREASQKSLNKLKECFQKGQCDRVTRNHIPAVIDQSDLHEVLRCSNISAKRLLNNEGGPHPELTFPVGFQLRCLHGRQRIQAAREVLPPRERWWTVDLYLAGLRNRGSEVAVADIYSRPRQAAQDCPDRGVLQRGATVRWRDILQDPTIPARARSLLGEPVVGSPVEAWNEVSRTAVSTPRADGGL